MISGIAHHIWLLITLRHPMSGLPRRSVGLLVFVFTASACIAAIRASNPMVFVVHGLLLCVMTLVAPVRIATAYALASLGIDLFAMPIEAESGERYMPFFTVWEVICAAYIMWRSLR